jgi:transposase-like protein
MNTGQDNAQRKLHNRIFSEDFKKQKVKELDDKTISICQLVTLYSISRTTVYKWLAKYSVHYHKETKMVVQMESETHKLQSVLQRQAELERIIGQKQLEIDYLNKLLEIGSHELKIDLKKSFSDQLSTGFPPIKENTSGK